MPNRTAHLPCPANRLTRRQSLAALAAGLPLAGLTGSRATGQETNSPRPGDSARAPIVDTHLHCFAGPDDPRFPYHARAPYRPPTKATPEHLVRCMNGGGVDFAVVVHPEPYQDDHRYLEHCLDIGEGRLKGTSLFFADRPDSLRRMPEFLRRNSGRLVATRLHAYAPDRLPPFGSDELRQMWRIAADHGVALQLHLEPRYAARLDSLVREFSSQRLIIDHLGRPMQGTPAEHAVVMRWAELPNTVMKVSAIPSQNSYPHREIGPVIRVLTDAWGADRMIYGGGFGATATPQSYGAVRQTIARHLTHLTESDRAKIFGGTAARLFQLTT